MALPVTRWEQDSREWITELGANYKKMKLPTLSGSSQETATVSKEGNTECKSCGEMFEVWGTNKTSAPSYCSFDCMKQWLDYHIDNKDGEGSQFELKEWYHIAGIKEKAELKFYVDGKEVGKYNVPKDHAQGAEKLYIGRTGYRSATFIMDDLYVYNRALEEKEINEVKEGKLLPVEPQDKLAALWAHIKQEAH